MKEQKVSIEYLRDLSNDKLLQMQEDLKRKQFEMRQQETFRKGLRVARPHLYKKTRKDIAKILTILNERKLNGN